MIGEKSQRIFRELSSIEIPLPQSEIARRCECSHSFVNKEIKDLVKRRLMGRPSRTRVVLTNRPGLLVLWIGRRGIRRRKIETVRTDLGAAEVLDRISGTGDHALTLTTGARMMGITEGVTTGEVQVYLPSGSIQRLDIPRGERGASLVILPSDDGHLYRTSSEMGDHMVASDAQVFVDLADWGTWEAHSTAVRMALERDGYPILATRQELEAFL